MDYVVAVQAPAYPLGGGALATESAFAAHLRELRGRLSPRFTRLVLLAPQMPQAQYEASRRHLGTLDPAADGVSYVPLHPADTGAKDFWLHHLRSDRAQIGHALAHAGVVQTGLSDDTYKPFMALLNVMAYLRRIPVVFVVDIDYRQNAARNYALGVWSKKSYLSNVLVHDPLRNLQVALAPSMFQLVLLKSASMVRDFGRGRANVKNFYDTVHAPSDILSDEALGARAAFLEEAARPLELVYFGRFVPYKGLDRAVEALKRARDAGVSARLTLIGGGECEPALRAQVSALGLTDAVRFEGPVRYGDALFALLGRCDVALSTPLREDTPRSAFDAMARGLPILAFDIGYFRDLAGESGAVALSRWPEPADLAAQIGKLAADRSQHGAPGRGLRAREHADPVDRAAHALGRRGRARARAGLSMLTRSRGQAGGSGARSRRSRSA